MDVTRNGNPKLLLIDTCAEGAGVALSFGEQVREIEALTPRGASAEIVTAVRRLLATAGWTLADLDAVGVVNGPGSFTGVRSGLAAAKGFCEARSLRLAAVSRLEVLAEAGGDGSAMGNGLAALDAGRGELYVRERQVSGAVREWVCGVEYLRAIAAGRTVWVAETRVAERLGGSGVIMRTLTVGDALRPVLRRLREDGNDAATVDGNYVRGEADIYVRKASGPDGQRAAAHGDFGGRESMSDVS